MKISILELVEVIRSKNSGPYELTFDFIFKNKKAFQTACKSGVFTKELFVKKYGIDVSAVISIVEFAPANAIKATIIRPTVSGGPGDTDVYGAQQHAPLLDIEIPTG